MVKGTSDFFFLLWLYWLSENAQGYLWQRDCGALCCEAAILACSELRHSCRDNAVMVCVVTGLGLFFSGSNEAECLHALANPSIVVCASLPIILVTLFPCVRCCTHRTHTSLHQLLWSKPTARRRACPMVASAEWQVNNSWSCIVWCGSVQTMVVHVIVLAHRLPWLLIFSGIAAYFEFTQVQALVAQPTSRM